MCHLFDANILWFLSVQSSQYVVPCCLILRNESQEYKLAPVVRTSQAWPFSTTWRPIVDVEENVFAYVCLWNMVAMMGVFVQKSKHSNTLLIQIMRCPLTSILESKTSCSSKSWPITEWREFDSHSSFRFWDKLNITLEDT